MLDQSESVVTDNGIEEAEEADNGGYTDEMGSLTLPELTTAKYLIELPGGCNRF